MRTMLRITLIAIAAWSSICVAAPVPFVPDADIAISSMSPEEARVVLKNAAGYLCIRCSFTRVPRQITGIDLVDDQVLVFIQANGDRSQTLPVSALAVHGTTLDDYGKVFFTAAADNQVVLLIFRRTLQERLPMR